jgi:SagB-type dehydrogenase family enzyme
MNTFKQNYPVAWEFHKNSSRSIFQLFDSNFERKIDSPYKEYPQSETIRLTDSKEIPGELSNAILSRRSCRDFKGDELGFDDISTLLQIGFGKQGSYLMENQESFQRPAPSAGGLYPIEIYLITLRIESIPNGIYHYCIEPSMLEQIRQVQIPDSLLATIFMNQYYIAGASAIIVATSSFNRTMWKYGDRGYRYILLEVGHIFQNLNLICTALDLGSLNMGGFFDEDLSRLLNIDINNEAPLYAMAVGHKFNI